ncbi:MAG: arsenite methyltransferase [candidate division WOR-3 bacterium]|nr:arsenite methyltransferase [candidate division WOR-3 bacterium]
MKNKNIKKIVKERYQKIALTNSSCCSKSQVCCDSVNVDTISKKIGYTKNELKSIPKDAVLGLGCGNPLAFALIKKGDVVLDLGCGAGIDTFLAARKVGPNGKAIGVDMTPEMINKARANAKKGNYKNVEFRLGEIENFPVSDNSVDLIISNCVINLSPNKKQVFKEAYRVLKPNGKLIIADIVLEKALPPSIKKSIDAYIGCVAGAMLKTKYLETIKKAGFKNIKILRQTVFPLDCVVKIANGQTKLKNLHLTAKKTNQITESVSSIIVSATKPTRNNKYAS